MTWGRKSEDKKVPDFVFAGHWGAHGRQLFHTEYITQQRLHDPVLTEFCTEVSQQDWISLMLSYWLTELSYQVNLEYDVKKCKTLTFAAILGKANRSYSYQNAGFYVCVQAVGISHLQNQP